MESVSLPEDDSYKEVCVCCVCSVHVCAAAACQACVWVLDGCADTRCVCGERWQSQLAVQSKELPLHQRTLQVGPLCLCNQAPGCAIASLCATVAGCIARRGGSSAVLGGRWWCVLCVEGVCSLYSLKILAWGASGTS
jgi:hypothetical protein